MSNAFYQHSLIVILTIFGLTGLPVTSFADNSWGNYHWARQQSGFTLQLGDNVSNTWKEHLKKATTDWHGSSVLDTTIVTGGTSPRTCKPTRGRVEVCSEKYGFNGWLGIAQIWISGGHITQAITKVNDSYFNTATYNKPEWRQFVMCQEVGHTFGLDHQDENFSNGNMGTCMDYTSNPAGPPSNEHPNSHDYQQLQIIYEHLDSTTTVGGTSGTQKGKVPPPFANIDSDEPVEVGTGRWGQLIRSTNGGRTELFELNLGDGRKIFTHVIWVDPEHDETGQGHGQGRR